jgi:hypothetical protein
MGLIIISVRVAVTHCMPRCTLGPGALRPFGEFAPSSIHLLLQLLLQLLLLEQMCVFLTRSWVNRDTIQHNDDGFVHRVSSARPSIVPLVLWLFFLTIEQFDRGHESRCLSEHARNLIIEDTHNNLHLLWSRENPQCEKWTHNQKRRCMTTNLYRASSSSCKSDHAIIHACTLTLCKSAIAAVSTQLISLRRWLLVTLVTDTGTIGISYTTAISYNVRFHRSVSHWHSTVSLGTFRQFWTGDFKSSWSEIPP